MRKLSQVHIHMRKILLIISAVIIFWGCKKDSGGNNNNDDGGNSSTVASHTCGAKNVHNPALNYDTATDIDGNIYKTIQVGSQIWMAENLKTSKYSDGTPIPNITDNNSWIGLKNGAYCIYNNTTNDCPYGKLYNWYAVNDKRGICPQGWRVPTDADYFTLLNLLGGMQLSGGKMKSTGTAFWKTPNVGAINSSGFSSLPGGARNDEGRFVEAGNIGSWWTRTDYGSNTGAMLYQGYWSDSTFGGGSNKNRGFSVRCVKDTSVQNNINSGLVAFYPFNGNANDESGNGNNGIVNGASLTADRFGNGNKAYNFDGINDNIKTSNITFGGGQFYSISFWVNLNTSYASGFPQHYILDNGTVSNFIAINTDFNQTAFACLDKPSPNNVNKWVNYVCIKNSTDLQIYIGGVLNSSSNLCNKNFSNTRNLVIGSTNLDTEFTNGKIDDIRIYNRILTQQEIAWLANN